MIGQNIAGGSPFRRQISCSSCGQPILNRGFFKQQHSDVVMCEACCFKSRDTLPSPMVHYSNASWYGDAQIAGVPSDNYVNGFCCDGCRGNFRGTPFWHCQQCGDFDLCPNCFHTFSHSSFYAGHTFAFYSGQAGPAICGPVPFMPLPLPPQVAPILRTLHTKFIAHTRYPELGSGLAPWPMLMSGNPPGDEIPVTTERTSQPSSLMHQVVLVHHVLRCVSGVCVNKMKWRMGTGHLVDVAVTGGWAATDAGLTPRGRLPPFRRPDEGGGRGGDLAAWVGRETIGYNRPALPVPLPRDPIGRQQLVPITPFTLLHAHLSHLDRDFTMQDYEVLLLLDGMLQAEQQRLHQQDRGATDEQLATLVPRLYLPAPAVTDPPATGLSPPTLEPALDEGEKHPAGIVQETCTICLEDFKANDMVTTLPCAHAFHADCIRKWLQLNAVCPNCKARVFHAPTERAQGEATATR
ncbi:putative RING finger protein [Paratrimastix pyriformis]|uniref:RING finger protein n=1 Tax=Paratrimastix pyriformis TaxID=342808 RepID=A0ABQ8UX88_9EUKA|nr:putative RING finger protein [Paratrimastix pyriformis]